MEKGLSEPLRRPLLAMPALSGRPGSAWTVLLGWASVPLPRGFAVQPHRDAQGIAILVVGGRRHMW